MLELVSGRKASSGAMRRCQLVQERERNLPKRPHSYHGKLVASKLLCSLRCSQNQVSAGGFPKSNTWRFQQPPKSVCLLAQQETRCLVSPTTLTGCGHPLALIISGRSR
ncbi:hypothetical protein J6590_048842 [Homalodisca vitripennis]|nr:hypothetical protein J6590_048842 [Homalodisca vitripennis]